MLQPRRDYNEMNFQKRQPYNEELAAVLLFAQQKVTPKQPAGQEHLHQSQNNS